MGRVKRYKRMKSLTYDDDDETRDRPPPKATAGKKSESYKMRRFKQLMAMSETKKSAKESRTIHTSRDAVQDVSTTKTSTTTFGPREREPSLRTKASPAPRGDFARRRGESVREFNRRMRKKNNEIIIKNVKSQQKKTAKRKQYFEKKKRKKQKQRERRANRDDDVRDFRKAEVVPFGEVNDTVPTITVVPRLVKPKSTLSPMMQRERAKVMRAYKEMLERRKRGRDA